MCVIHLAQPAQNQGTEDTKKPDCVCNRVSSSDPVGIRTPNLRIRSAMLYPVELQGPPRARVGDSGGKDRQAFSPTKPARQKLHEKRNPHRRRPMALPPRGFTDADPPGKRPLFRAFAPSGLRHPAMTFAGHAGHPGDFTRRRQSEPKSMACSTSCSRPTQRDPPKSVRLPHKACALFDQHDCSCRDGVLVLHCWRPRFVTLLLSPTALGVRGGWGRPIDVDGLETSHAFSASPASNLRPKQPGFLFRFCSNPVPKLRHSNRSSLLSMGWLELPLANPGGFVLC